MPATSPESKEKERLRKARNHERRRSEYVAAHGRPVCECGCGEKVNFNSADKPYRFLRGHNPRDRTKAARVTPGSVPVEECIPIEDFRAALRKQKERDGCTWEVMAERTGIGLNHMKALMYAKDRRHVSKDWATIVLRRLAGMSAPPSTWQQRDRRESNRRHRSVEVV
jgi:hypothetical protein